MHIFFQSFLIPIKIYNFQWVSFIYLGNVLTMSDKWGFNLTTDVSVSVVCVCVCVWVYMKETQVKS